MTPLDKATAAFCKAYYGTDLAQERAEVQASLRTAMRAAFLAVRDLDGDALLTETEKEAR